MARMGPLGFPADALANSRFMFTLPRSWLQWMVEVIANFRFDHENYGLKARHRYSQTRHNTVCQLLCIEGMLVTPFLAGMQSYDSILNVFLRHSRASHRSPKQLMHKFYVISSYIIVNRALEAHPTINDDLPHRIMVGKVQVRPNVARFGRNFVEFDDGTGVEVDAVIFATGQDHSCVGL